MRTALLDPEDESGRDSDWYKITWFEGSCSTQCNICGVGYFGGTTADVMNKIILCGIGHILAGREWRP